MHILQSPDWKKFQKSLGKSAFTDKGDGWEYLATLETTPIGPYLMTSRGPFLASGKALKPALNSLEPLARSKKAFFIRIEPEINSPALKKLKKVKSIHPEHTWILDLDPDKEALLANMKQNNRNLWKNYQKKGIKITKTKDPENAKYLSSLLKGVAAHNKIQIYGQNYFAGQLKAGFATLYLAHYGGKVIATALAYDFGNTRYYGHAAADYEHRKLSAGTILVAEMILDAKQKGLKHFDFWGITLSEDPDHPWAGFTKFKKSFGGHPVTYPGTYDLILNKPKYAFYSVIRPVNLFFRKLIKAR